MMMSIIPEQMLSQHFNMYYTDQTTGNLDRHCLSYTVLDDIVELEKTPLFQHQNILYCFRSSDTWTGNDEKSYRINYGDVQATENDACHYGSSAELVSTH